MAGRVPAVPRANGGADGPALKRAIHAARAAAGINADTTLARIAGVSYDTLHNWYSGRTTPRPHELAKVARALDVPVDTLWAAYEGRRGEAPELTDLLRRHNDLLLAQNEMLLRLVRLLSLGAVAEATRQGIGDANAIAAVRELLETERTPA